MMSEFCGYSKAAAMKGLALPLLALLGLSTAAQANIQYQCDNYQGAQVFVTVFDEEGIAQVQYGSQMETLSGADEGNSFRYVSDGFDFYGQGLPNAALWLEGSTLNCVAYNVTEPGSGQQGGGGQNAGGGGAAYDGMPALSWGGNLRAGPGMNFAGVGSLREREPITIIQDSGVSMNGSNWFLVRTQRGQQAYHWGGIMCVPGAMVQGVYGNC